MEWLQKYYRTLGNSAAELEVTGTLFQTQPFLRHYQELRDLARATWSLGDTIDSRFAVWEEKVPQGSV